MRANRIALVLFTCVFLAGAAFAEDQKPAADHGTPVRPNVGFDLMKSLVGSWEMPGKDGAPTCAVSFTLVSGGTALMETMDMGEAHSAMITVYHPDGDKLMMTHYCGANNQPRMRCLKPSAEGKSLDFEFVGGSNMPTPATGHMHHLVIKLDDTDHMTEEWTWKEAAKSGTEVFHFARKVS